MRAGSPSGPVALSSRSAASCWRALRVRRTRKSPSTATGSAQTVYSLRTGSGRVHLAANVRARTLAFAAG
eukprot:7708591-Alexandrium_andersonii.AAC.1